MQNFIVKGDTSSVLYLAQQSSAARSAALSGESGSSRSTFQSFLPVSNADGGAVTTADSSALSTRGGLMSDHLTPSDWDLIQEITGLTPANDYSGGWYDSNGDKVISGPAVKQAEAMVFGMADMRMFGLEDTSGDMVPISGELGVEELHRYFDKYAGQRLGTDANAYCNLLEAAKSEDGTDGT